MRKLILLITEELVLLLCLTILTLPRKCSSLLMNLFRFDLKRLTGKQSFQSIICYCNGTPMFYKIRTLELFKLSNKIVCYIPDPRGINPLFVYCLHSISSASLSSTIISLSQRLSISNRGGFTY